LDHNLTQKRRIFGGRGGGEIKEQGKQRAWFSDWAENKTEKEASAKP
jgi:hypothetical protein